MHETGLPDDFILDCVICCCAPVWDIWLVGERNVPLYALQCDNGLHSFSTSYWKNKQQAIDQWNVLMEGTYWGVVDAGIYKKEYLCYPKTLLSA